MNEEIEKLNTLITHSLTQSVIHSLPQSINHTHSLIHSVTYAPNRVSPSINRSISTPIHQCTRSFYLALGDKCGPALGAGVPDLYGVVSDRTAPVIGWPAPRQRH